VSPAGPFVVGVVYQDENPNGFYDSGEGLAGVTVTPDAGPAFATTGTAGGFAFPVGTSGTITITASGGGLSAPIQKQVTLTGNNVKVDFIQTGVSANTGATDTICVLKDQVTGKPPERRTAVSAWRNPVHSRARCMSMA